MGPRASEVPLFDGLCSRCGELLFGKLNSSAGGGNKKNGEPRDAEGNPWPLSAAAQSQQQPPFLLRYSPKFLAQSVPELFAWSQETNRLRLQEDHVAHPPWKIRSGTKAKGAEKNSWLYCPPCHESLFSDKPKPAVPLRDEASAAHMKPDPKVAKRDAGTRTTPAMNRPQSTTEAGSRDAEEPKAVGSEEPEPAGPKDIEALRAEWEEKKQWFARAPGGRFSLRNLVPAPRPELWQDAPHSPLEKLRGAWPSASSSAVWKRVG